MSIPASHVLSNTYFRAIFQFRNLEQVLVKVREVHNMTITFKMVVVKSRPSDSFLFVDNQPYTPCNGPKDDMRGIAEAMGAMFIELSHAGIREVVARGSLRLRGTTPRDTTELVDIDPLSFYFTDKHGNHRGTHMQRLVLECVQAVVGLITWEEGRFAKEEKPMSISASSYHRTCVVCKHVQEGGIVECTDLTGTPIVEWPSQYCLNPECSSHEIEKMINPDHAILVEA
ncbi:MAG: hypothetical protein BMS9Abin13_266 [Patescibacteria group bacterium]|nr:MAG: hypothetical protein BMS9Abin13_266 [Patescibacteria group bacterium]